MPTFSPGRESRRERDKVDPQPDEDWLGEDGSIEWFLDEAEPTARARSRRASWRASARSVDDEGADWAGDDLAPLYLRRRLLVGLAAVGFVAAVVVLGLIVFSGGGAPAKPSTTVVTTSGAATTVPTAPAHHTSPASGSSTASLRLVLPASVAALRSGDTGALVKKLQESLTRLGYAIGKPDGVFGPRTEKAVVAFQKAHGLAADGAVGPKTAAKLNTALAARLNG